VRKSISELVTVLVADHQEFDGGVLRTEEALLVRLREAVSASTGGSGSSGASTLPSERTSMNDAAFVLWEDITGRIASMMETATDERSTKDPRRNLRRWLKAWKEAVALGEVLEAQELRQAGVLVRMAERIRDLFDPPTVKEIVGVCPSCRERWWFTNAKAGTRTSVLHSVLRTGMPVVVSCYDCGEHWTGERELMRLGLVLELWPRVEALTKHHVTLAGDDLVALSDVFDRLRDAAG